MQMKTSALIGTIYIHAYTPVQTHTKTCACVCVNIHEHMCVIYVHVCVHLELAHVHPCTGVPARGHGQSVALTPETPQRCRLFRLHVGRVAVPLWQVSDKVQLECKVFMAITKTDDKTRLRPHTAISLYPFKTDCGFPVVSPERMLTDPCMGNGGA